MDDGFQNPSLAKDFAILVIDGRRGVGNGRVFPAGPLRAPLHAQLARAQAVIVVGEIGAADPILRKAAALGLPVFHGRLEPDTHALATLAAKAVLAFAGIADPEKFFATLTAAGIRIELCRGFGDHHRYSASDAARLLAEADRDGLALVTTDKDLVRISGEPALAALAARVATLPVELRIEEETEFRRRLLEAIRNHANGRRS